jgi:hypothetical protein
MISHRFARLLALLLWFGCSDAGLDHPEPVSEPEPDRSDDVLCPTCVARAGGETGDLDPTPCAERREPIAEDDSVVGFTAAALRPLLELEVETTLGWRDGGGETVPGLEESATLSLRVHTGDAFRVRSTPKGDTPPEACRDRLEIDAEVALSADDGSIAGRFEAVRIRADSPEYATASVQADLSAFRGSLELNPDLERAHMGAMHGEFVFYGGGIRGRLEPMLIYMDMDEEEPDVWVQSVTPLSGRFPADSCSEHYRPVEPAEALGEPLFSDLIDAARARIARQNPIAADWDGSTVELVFELGETRDHCLRIWNGAVTAEDEVFAAMLTGTVAARSSDERLATQQAMHVEIDFDRSGELGEVWLSLEGNHVPVADFEDRFGLAGVDAHGSLCAQLRLLNVYGQNAEGDFADGQLEVDGFACHLDRGTVLEYAEWCTQGTCTRTPSPWW